MLKRLQRRMLLLFIRVYGAPAVLRASKSARRPTGASPRVLLLRPDYPGDVILTTPVLNALREAIPGARVTMMVGPWAAPVVESHPALERLVAFPFPGVRGAHKFSLRPLLRLRAGGQLRRERYDLAVNLRLKSWWISALLYLAGIPRRVGFASRLSAHLLTHALDSRPDEHLSAASLRLLSAGIESLGYPPWTSRTRRGATPCTSGQQVRSSSGPGNACAKRASRRGRGSSLSIPGPARLSSYGAPAAGQPARTGSARARLAPPSISS